MKLKKYQSELLNLYSTITYEKGIAYSCRDVPPSRRVVPRPRADRAQPDTDCAGLTAE
jgi:hypothetical protein